MAIYVGSFIDYNFTIDTEADMTSASVVLVVKSKTKRIEKTASTEDGTNYYVSFSSLDTTDSGNYYVQPVIKYSNGDELPCSISSFELKERL